MSTIEIKVPDIGDAKNVDVIEVFVKVGDVIAENDSLIALETDKATMEVPATQAGVVQSVAVVVGDKVSEGHVILTLSSAAVAATAPAPVAAPAPIMPAAVAPVPVLASQSSEKAVAVPDIGDAKNVDVIEVFVKVGDVVAENDPLIALETDKATMEVPAPFAGVVSALTIKVGDKVSEGHPILSLTIVSAAPVLAAAVSAPAPVVASVPAPVVPPAAVASSSGKIIDEAAFRLAHASPSVRVFARELGADLGKIKGTGQKNRILHSDVQAYVKQALAQVQSGAFAAPVVSANSGSGLDLLPWPKVDFAKFGVIESKPLSRIKKLSGANLARNWVMIPHVTFNDECDLTELEAFRKQMGAELEKKGIKISPLAFVIKAAAAALQAFPEFNSSLDGDNLVLKKYYHIGFAADTPNGLVVPVIKNVDQKGVVQIAKELNDLSALAREGKLKPTDMQGASFTISSLGGIGGTSFTPIVNAPEVAILGVCKSQIKPVWNGKEFAPRLMCPLSLSFDHRVLDGAAAARFTVYLGKLLSDVRRLIL